MGASDCGKSTLISCILGLLQLDAGDVRIFGEENILKNRSQIGYMPQTCALIDELTVKETIVFFGNIQQLDDEMIIRRYLMLNEMLELPNGDQIVKSCSGGQKRRISLAVALIHNPRLLILDEPTSGVDPVLREKIWDFLINASTRDKVTIIVTTQYIEEARKATRCGLMRNGILLDEDAPLSLMEKYECDTLEDAFLKLSFDNEHEIKKDEISLKFPRKKRITRRMTVNWAVLMTLLMKNLKSFMRNPA